MKPKRIHKSIQIHSTVPAPMAIHIVFIAPQKSVSGYRQNDYAARLQDAVHLREKTCWVLDVLYDIKESDDA